MADKFDIYFQGVAEKDINSMRFFTFGFNRSIAVRGIQKLILLWLKRLMTPRETDPTDLEAGTEFPNLIGSNISTMADVRDVVLLSINDCTDQIKNIQRVTMPDEDEMLASASLVKFQSLGDDGFEAWVDITNVRGTTLTVDLPSMATRST
jgi:hypothetical protein